MHHFGDVIGVAAEGVGRDILLPIGGATDYDINREAEARGQFPFKQSAQLVRITPGINNQVSALHVGPWAPPPTFETRSPQLRQSQVACGPDTDAPPRPS